MRISDWSSDVCSSDLGNVTSATDPSGATHSWVYDESSRVISETDAAGAVTTYGYVGDSRVPTTATDAVGGVTTVDVVGGLVRSIADADGVTTTLEDRKSTRLNSSH